MGVSSAEVRAEVERAWARLASGGPSGQGGQGGRRFSRHRRATRQRKRLLISVGVAGAVGVAVLLAVSMTGSGSRVPSAAQASAQASARSNASAGVDGAGMVAIPGSETIARMPSASPTPAKPVPKPPVTTAPVSTAGTTITAGDSKAHCIIADFPGGVLDQSIINGISSATGVTYSCLGTFANPAPSWDAWEAPWMFSTTSDGWDAWLKADPAHQAIMGMDLIPQSVSDGSGDPLTWEQSCASGGYNQYATALAQNLVSYGAGNIVIRLGVEANGNWEADYVGTTSQEMTDWAQCFDNEVSAMRAVTGAHFLFVWNPNVCTADLPLDQWYPGNSYVDIIGVDAYDQDCSTLNTVSEEGWSAYANDSGTNSPNDPNFPSLNNLEAFATAHGKPLAFPEWGLDTGLPDDTNYVAGMGQMFSQDDFSFESYFDAGDDGIATLGSDIPNATNAYAPAFK